jgi:hypothetical protein
MTTIAAADAAAGHAANPVTVILLLIAAAAGYAVSLYVWPIRACPRCRGTRVSQRGTSRRIGTCRRCSGTGRIRRIGATAVHRLYWSALGGQLYERRRERIARRRHQPPPPQP